MANENKNIKELVSDDDDPTAELEIPTFQHSHVDDDILADRESDSHTCGLAKSDELRTQSGQTIPELQSDLESRSKTIGRLQYDIQQLRSKWLGLEAEIGAREEIVAKLLNDTDKLNQKVDRKNKLLRKQKASIKSLKSEIAKRDKDRVSLEETIAGQELAGADSQEARDAAERALDEARVELELARTEIADTVSQLSQRGDDYIQLESQLEEQQKLAAEHEATLELTNRELDELKTDLEATRKENHDLNIEVNLRDELESEFEQKLAENEAQLVSKRSAEARYADELETAAKELARLNLELETARRQSAAQITQTQKTTSSVVKELQVQREKTEQYADSLRYQLEDSNDSLSRVSAQRNKLDGEVLELTERCNGLSSELDTVQATNQELLTSLDHLKTDHEQEIRLLRFELTEAQESVTQSDELNIRLAADLTTTRDTKQDLEKALQDKKEDAKRRTTELEKQLTSLASKAQELEQKLDTKNTAINVLLGELEKKTEQIDSIGEIEEVIQDIDSRMSERFDEPARESIDQRSSTPVGADRITRVLVGNIGDQELRFPLFKNRLTIGRTAENDIQLKTSYISRRHAVVLTEGEATRVIDWGSKNGVYVNNKRIKECFLSNGDIVAVGNAKFRYEERPKRET